jgi:hypothetical protein
MRFPGLASWEIRTSAGGYLETFALWLRDVERIVVPESPLVPGPLDVDVLPSPSGAPHDPRLGAQWLEWWVSAVGNGPVVAPGERLPPTGDTPDPLGLAPLPALKALAARRWPDFQDWRTAQPRFTGPERAGMGRTGNVVREIERELGRKVKPFKLRFTLLPVRDERIVALGPAHFLVPLRVHESDRWPVWLDSVVRRVA